MALIVTAIDAAFQVYFWLIIAHVIFSWIPVRQPWLMDLRELVDRLVEPYLGIFRRFVPMLSVGGGGLDLSPLVAILILQFANRLVVGYLMTIQLP